MVSAIRSSGGLLRLLATALMIWLACASPAEARRAALIIGNSAYVNTTPLTNPVNDAQLVAAAARKAGFDVTLLTNLGRSGFDQALRDFRAQADGAEVAMVYFAGHGIESGGRNWLLPVDVQLSESRDLRFEALELDGLLETLSGAQLKLVILDACRNNPFGSNWRGASRSVSKGLAETEVEGALVIYAAAGGQVATDGAGGNSPFAKSLAARLPEPGLSIHRLGSAVLDDVVTATGGQQRPWTNMSIASREFFLVDPPVVAAVPAPAPVAAAAPVNNTAMDALMWQGADQANNLSAFQAYLGAFPTGIFANTAKDRIARLQTPAAQPAVPVTAKAPEPVAAPAPQLAAVVTPTPTPMSAPVTTASRTVPQIEQPAPAYAATPAPTPAPAPAAAFVPAPAAVPVETSAPAFAPAAATQPRFTSSSNLLEASGPPPTPSAARIASVNGFIPFNVPLGVPALPGLPAAPRFAADGYPACREDFAKVVDPIGKVTAINQCMSTLDSYFESALNGFAKSMILHQEEIARIYSQSVGGKGTYSPEEQGAFYRAMMQEHVDSNPGGPNFAEYSATRTKYDADRAYLKDRYCFATGSCGGYPVPAGIAPSGK